MYDFETAFVLTGGDEQIQELYDIACKSQLSTKDYIKLFPYLTRRPGDFMKGLQALENWQANLKSEKPRQMTLDTEVIPDCTMLSGEQLQRLRLGVVLQTKTRYYTMDRQGFVRESLK